MFGFGVYTYLMVMPEPTILRYYLIRKGQQHGLSRIIGASLLSPVYSALSPCNTSDTNHDSMWRGCTWVAFKRWKGWRFERGWWKSSGRMGAEELGTLFLGLGIGFGEGRACGCGVWSDYASRGCHAMVPLIMAYMCMSPGNLGRGRDGC